MGRPGWFLELAVVVLGLGMAGGAAAQAFDPPHDFTRFISCNDCHITPVHASGSITNAPGNANLCLSCHTPGGSATGRRMVDADQALPRLGLPESLAGQGTSHRWDSSVSGRVSYLGGAPESSSGTIQSGGIYSGHFAKTITVTITTSGNSGEARFDWSASVPDGGGGSGVLTGPSVSLGDGVTLSFVDGGSAPSFHAADQWHLFVRPDLNAPTHPDLLPRMKGGEMSCSVCHNQHTQENTPFDPDAPAYDGEGTGEGRHLQRIDNASGQLCAECHAARMVTGSAGGSHPVGILPLNDDSHRPPVSLPLDTVEGRIRCQTCHQVHRSASSDGHLLRVSDRVSLCTECHTHSDKSTPARHLTPSPEMAWPGGQYGSLFPAANSPGQEGSCEVCHQAHGWPDTSNPAEDYPRLLVEREENLCFTCHDGSPSAKDIRAIFNKTYKHPVALYTGRHDPAERGNPASYGQSNRHAECADCHNPHKLTAGPSGATPPAAPGPLQGAARVSVNNVSATTVSYIYRGPEDSTPAKEYEICFTCHSGWTTQPAGQSNLAADFNDLNPSFHPVEAVGKNANINPNAFANNWTADSLMYCTDCHGSDGGEAEGPHGSNFRYILKSAYTASSSARTMSSDEICFDCHNYDTYANNSASTTVKGYSRFNPPTFSRGHTYHVGSRRYPCYACHETHGSTTRPNLIVTGRSPGLNNFSRTSNGGSCSPTCHGSQSYTINYAR